MSRVDVETATSCFSELLDRVKQGEEIAIIERGKSVAKLIAHPPRRRDYRSIVGCWKGLVDVSGADEDDKAIYRKLGMLA